MLHLGILPNNYSVDSINALELERIDVNELSISNISILNTNKMKRVVIR